MVEAEIHHVSPITHGMSCDNKDKHVHSDDDEIDWWWRTGAGWWRTGAGWWKTGAVCGELAWGGGELGPGGGELGRGGGVVSHSVVSICGLL